MGSPKRLKIKDDLKYRKGGTGHFCSHCNHYKTIQTRSVPDKTEPRCDLIGLATSARYRINPSYICDRYDNSKHLNRLGRL